MMTFNEKVNTLAKSKNFMQARQNMRALIGAEFTPFKSAPRAHVTGIDWAGIRVGECPNDTRKYITIRKVYSYSVRPTDSIRVYYEYA